MTWACSPLITLQQVPTVPAGRGERPSGRSGLGAGSRLASRGAQQCRSAFWSDSCTQGALRTGDRRPPFALCPWAAQGLHPPQVVKTEPMRVITNHRDSDEPQQSLKVWKAGLACSLVSTRLRDCTTGGERWHGAWHRLGPQGALPRHQGNRPEHDGKCLLPVHSENGGNPIS